MRFYTVLEVATMLKVHQQTIRRMIARGEIGGQKVGKGYRISQEQLDDFLKGDK